jgi:hypothetical protein
MAGQTDAWHESLRSHEQSAGPSDRAFGLVFAGVCAIAGMISLWRHRGSGLPLLVIGLMFLIAALVIPGLLSPLNRLWMWFGRRIQVIVNPVVMVILFYGVIFPVGLIMRAFGKDPFQQRRDPHATTYWIERSPDADRLSSMKNQF